MFLVRKMQFPTATNEQFLYGLVYGAKCHVQQHANRFFHLGVHVPFYLHFGGTSKFLEVQHSRVQRKCLNCIFSTQGRAPCCFLSILRVLTVTVLLIGQLKNKEPIEMGDLSIISSYLKYARNALIG